MSDEVTVATCPECAQGKVQNCAQLALLGDDLVPCRNSREITDPPPEVVQAEMAEIRREVNEERKKKVTEVWPRTEVVIEYHELPPLGPISQLAVHACHRCGAVVRDRDLHNTFHEMYS